MQYSVNKQKADFSYISLCMQNNVLQPAKLFCVAG